MELDSHQIIEIYRGLWKIEESFKVTKSDLAARPVYLSNLEHIQAHFLICFVALVIVRLLEFRLNRKYSVGRILESLRRCESTSGIVYKISETRKTPRRNEVFTEKYFSLVFCCP